MTERKKRKKWVGTYKLTHVPSGRYYVGSSGDLVARMSQHKLRLVAGIHKNPTLQEVFTVWEDMTFDHMVCDTRDHAYTIEQEMLDEHLTDPLCCNIASNALVPWKDGMPDSVRAKISKFHKGRDYGEAFRKMRSELMTGIPRTEAQKQKLAIALKGRKRPPEVCQKISEGRKGWVPSDETRARMSEGAKARAVDMDRIEKMSVAVSKPVMVDGVTYPSKAEVARTFGVSESTVQQRLVSTTERFKGWIKL